LIQRDLAARAHVSLRSVQDWEAGVTLPSAEHLQVLLRALLEGGGLTPGREMAEALDLWTAVERESPRMHTPFDPTWFSSLLSAPALSTVVRPGEPVGMRPTAQPVTLTPERTQDWGDAPDTAAFVGRADELALAQRWVVDEQCRLLAILGIGGIGKTSLAARLAQMVAPGFERVYWRSLRNAPPVTEWLAGAIAFVSDQQMLAPGSESEQMTSLLQLLRTRRCLLVLDNSEALFEVGQPEGRYRVGMEGYGRLLPAVAEVQHQSCLVLTSREAPPELGVLGRAARALELRGLGVAEAQALVADKHVRGDAKDWQSLVERYGGNGLALRIVGETIHQVYDGDIAAFLSDAIATYGTVFGGIRRLLDVQLERLSPLERRILRRLAVEREPISLAELSKEMAPSMRRSTVIDGIETLRRRSLVERAERGGTFTLQSMVLEHATDGLVETVVDEINRGEPSVLVEQPLIKAQAKDYVRQAQERLIGTPIVQRLKVRVDDDAPDQHLLALLDNWRGQSVADQGYGPGNAVNLLRLLRGNLRGTDLSRLVLRQIYLQGVDAQDATMVDTRLGEAVLAQSFAYPTSVALSADGILVAAGTSTGEVRLWHAADRTLLLTMQWHAGTIWSVALSADGALLAVAVDDGTVRLIETRTEQVRLTLHGHTGAVRCVAFSADGDVVASGGDDGALRLWDAASGQTLATMEGHTVAIWGVALSDDGRLVASAGVDGTLRLWDAANGQAVATLEGQSAAIWSVALSGDGRLVASGGVDGIVRLWDTGSAQLVATLQGHTGAIWGVALSNSGQLVASGGTDGTLRLWHAESGQLLATLQGHTGAVRDIALSSDSRLLASGGVDGSVRLWDAARGQLLTAIHGYADLYVDVALSADGRLVVSGGADGTVHVWDVESGHLLAALQGHEGLVYRVAMSRNGRVVASAGADGTVRLWDMPLSSGQPPAILRGHIRLVFGVAVSGDGRLVATGGADGTVRLWDVESRQLLATLLAHTGGARAVAFSEDGQLLASGGNDGTVRLWDTPRGQLRASLRVHADAIRGVALSGDGRLLAGGDSDGTVSVWDAASGRLLATMSGHAGPVRGVALSTDGHLLASGDDEGRVRLWEPDTGQLLALLQSHTQGVLGVAFSGDGRLLATGSGDGTIKIWESNSGVCLNTLQKDRPFQRVDITGLSGVTEAQRAALIALGAREHAAQR
jgi:WD40 repeat protein